MSPKRLKWRLKGLYNLLRDIGFLEEVYISDATGSPGNFGDRVSGGEVMHAADRYLMRREADKRLINMKREAYMLLAGIDKLPDKLREILWGRYVEGITPDSLCIRVGCCLRTYKGRHSEGIKQLNEILSEAGGI